MFNLNERVKGLILHQFNMPGFVVSAWDALPIGRSGCGMGWGEVRAWRRGGRENFDWNIKRNLKKILKNTLKRLPKLIN